MRRIRLKNKTVLITGGSRGLGLLLAREFVRRGCNVAICARDPEPLARARDALSNRGGEVLTFTCDVGNRREVEQMVQAVHERFGSLDVLVNNASVIQVGGLESMTVEDFEQAMAVNFWGVVYASLAALPWLRRSAGGRIVNITSIGGAVAVPHLLPYDCAKFAAMGFSEGLRAELRKDRVAVTTVVPGLMRTGSPLHASFKGRPAQEFTWFGAGDLSHLTSMNARRAARRIVRAAVRGEAHVTLTWQAKLLRLFHSLFPGFTANGLGLVNRVLPRGDGAEPPEATGAHLVGGLPRPLRTALERAGSRANQ